MSEIKRVVLNTLETQKVSDKVIKKVTKTARITLILPESNEDEYPEFNYKDELAAAVKKKSKPVKDSSNCVENGLDPFGENDDDVRRIAQEMEAKYGSGVTKKKRKGRKDDYADIGMGYDESDPFIDNTDGYDEIIPQNVTTLHGGFYVNCGALVFKTDDEASSNASSSDPSSPDASSSSESEGEEKQTPKNRKRILETSDSDSDTANPNQKEKKPKVQSAATTMQQAIQKKLFSTTKIQVKKRRLIDPLKKTVKDLLREKREDLNMTVPEELKTVEDNIEKESSKENKKPMNITSVTDAIESVLKKVVQEEDQLDNNNINQTKPPSDVTPNVVLTQNKSDSQPSSLNKEKDNKPQLTRLEKEEMVKLPENLPADIEDLVSKMKEAALNYKGEGKKAFFTKEVNSWLLNLEKRSKSISKSSRVKVYEHLSQYVNCTKDTLTRRARVLDLEDSERRLKILENKLKESVAAIMPMLEEKYQQESEKIMQKFPKGDNNEDMKSLKLPRRKFAWSEETKKFLKDVVSLKKRCLTLEGKCKDNLLEEQIMDYLRKQIIPMWPVGWMYVNVMTKIINSMQDNSRPPSSTSSQSSSSTVTVKSVKHSNLSITPVTNGKTNTEKPEITNSLTVTKVVNNSEIDSAKKNHLIPDITIIKEKDERSNSNSYKDLEIITKHPSPPKVDPMDVPADLSIHPNKSDVFELVSDDSQFLEVNKVKPEQGKPLTYQKQPKQTEMFKPYADDISIERNIPEKPKVVSYEEQRLPHAEIIPQVAQHVDHSYPNKEKASGQSSYSEKSKQGVEKEKYSTHIFPVEEHIPHSYTERDKRIPQSYPDREKQSSHEVVDKDKHTNPEKDKRSTMIYPDKDKHSSVSYPDKDKHSTMIYPDKDKHSSVSYPDKDKHSAMIYPDKDKHSSASYPDKDKHSTPSYLEKEKYSDHGYAEKDKHAQLSYLEKDKHSSHGYVEKDKHVSLSFVEKDKHVSQGFVEKDKQVPHGYVEKDKHVSHSYVEKDKQVPHGYVEKDKHVSQGFVEKDKQVPHGYVEKDKHVSHSYVEKDKQVPHGYVEKDKHASRGYVEKDKHVTHGYLEKDKHLSHNYMEKDKHVTHGYVDKDKHVPHGYLEKDKDKRVSPAYLEKDKHSSRSHPDKEKHSSHSYSSKDKHSSHSYSNKEKSSSHVYVDKEKFAALAHSTPAQSTYVDKEKQSSSYSSKEKPSSHSYSDKERHVSHSYAADKDKHSYQSYSDKDRHGHSSHSERDKHKKYEDKLLHHQERASKLDNLLHNDKPANLSKQIDKPTDLSKFQMFKPYSETPKSHTDARDLTKQHHIAEYKAKEDKHHRTMDIPKSMPQDASNFTTKAFTTPSDFMNSRYDVSSSSKHRSTNAHGFTIGSLSNDIPQVSQVKEDNGVIVKNIQTKDINREDHHNPVIPLAAHCQGVKRKLMETYSRSAAELTSPNYYTVASNKHNEYSTSTPLVTKSEGDGQQDIQMVMENLKALQKLSCSPAKTDTSVSSPVSVISYNNKNFPSPKTTTAALNLGRGDANSRSEFPGGFQDEFQKQFINSLQQMAANAGSSKSSYNNGS
ncbi:uncharacterized protein LOC114340356 isoform X2 [Diabrotica virgifera virgifera]|uniref:Ubinuclein-1-like n=1 Tax=Diabrotica virgifera virgifera TaxID=50390 RepID=A0ABM5KCU4_DIAVI|nr:uncharacterized protein LOC114340356 isoform X2 [Diabrotica virgifera virgifera]